MTALISFTKPCDECGGTGDVPRQHDPDTGARLGFAASCPSCVDGWLPANDTLQAAASPICDSEDHCDPSVVRPCSDHLEIARAALVAAACYQSEGKP